MFYCCQCMIRAVSSGIRRMATNNHKWVATDNRKHRLIWVDCEMTGLDENKQTLVEIATIVTDEHLNIIAEGPDIVIHQPESVLDTMEEWSRNTFTTNGLLEKIRSSPVSMQQAEQMTLSFLKEETDSGKCPLAGNTVHMDKRFIDKYMPELAAHFHYRIVDVSTIKELSRRWFPSDYDSAPKKACTHRALDDIRESIQELRHYRETVFKKK